MSGSGILVEMVGRVSDRLTRWRLVVSKVSHGTAKEISFMAPLNSGICMERRETEVDC